MCSTAFLELAMKFFAALLCLLAPVASAQLSPAEEPGAGQLILATPFGARPAIQFQAAADIRITGLVAQVSLRQQFRNDTPDWVDAEYRFPLPSTAAVHRLRLEIGERVIEGQVQERAQARETFKQARASGRKAGLAEQQRPNLFSNRVANIAPGETVLVELQYSQRIDYEAGSFSLRLPTTLTPRYTPENMGVEAAQVWNIQWPQSPTPSQPLQPLQLSASIDMGMPLAAVASDHHSIKLSRQGHRYDIALTDGVTPMNRDITLRWRPQPSAQPRAAIFHERIGSEEYALLMVLPPASAEALAPLPRELVFVIDTSGSMGGRPIEQARASLLYALTQLRPQDSFNIIAFAQDAQRLYSASVPADDAHLDRARRFVQRLNAGGGTEMQKALELALPVSVSTPETRAETSSSEPNRLRQVVFITDGAVGNEVNLFREIHQRLGSSRLFTVAIGAAPNAWFMRKAAQIGRGRRVLIADIAQVQSQMQSLFERLGRPVLRDLAVAWPVTVDSYPQVLPDLYAGEPLWLTARSQQSIAGSEVVVSGRGAHGPWQQSVLAGPPVSDMEEAWHGMGKLWAQSAIEALLDEKTLGRPESDVRHAVLPIALKHQLLSPYTSFVAVEQQRSLPAGQRTRSRAVPNLRPDGQAPQQYAWPRTALGLGQHYLTGLLALLLACVCWLFPVWRWP